MNNRMIDFFEALRKKELTEEEISREISSSSNRDITPQTYNEYLDLVEGVKMAERNRLKTFLLAKEDNKEGKIKQLKPRKYIQYFAIAASITLLVFSSFSIFSFNHSVFEAFSLEEFAGNELGIVEMSFELVNPEKAYKKAIKLKNEEKYEAALVILKSIQKDNLLVQAKYNIALIHIKNRDYEKAKVELHKLIDLDENHYLVEKAKELIMILNQPKINFFLFRRG